MNKIQKLVDEIISELEIDSEKIYSERHLQAYLFHKLKKTLPIEWTTLVEPTLSTIGKKWKVNAKPFSLPDLVICRTDSIIPEKINSRRKSSEERIDIKNRCDAFAIALKLNKKRYGKNKAIKYKGIIDDKENLEKQQFSKFYVLYVNQDNYRPNSKKLEELKNTDWFKYIERSTPKILHHQ